ncbi:MAG TPA: hypothetical protein ENK43_06210 [Planctomycetes bacterium]|nr:hypothetical protein [Planctomycetota bacterium]
MNRRRIAFLLALIILRSGSAQSLDDPANLRKLTAEKSPAIVRIRARLKLNMAGPERSIDRELPGVALDASGMILCESSPLVSSQGPLTLTLQDIQVQFEAIKSPLDATLVYKDDSLGLAFLKLNQPASRPLPSLGLSKPDDLAPFDPNRLGHSVLTVSRLGDEFARAPLFHVTRINGVLRTPRTCWSVQDRGGDLALPVWSSSGALIGFNVTLTPKAEGGQGPSNPFATLLGRRSQGIHVILPPRDVLALMRKAQSEDLPKTKEQDHRHAPGKEPQHHDH